MAATGVYALLAVAMTWPLGLGLARDIPWDLGDPLLNCWILGWDLSRLAQLLSGDLGAWRGFWDANIFFPEPLTLAYSEHLMAQAIQVLPVYLLGGNLILCYNLLFLSTFVLSGLGAYLLVLDLTGNRPAAFVAGLFYAFAPYRVEQFSHLQVLSSQWMPFVLLGLRRFLHTKRAWPLVGAVLALVVQNLSCGYYLLYFAPFVVAYAVHGMGQCGRLADRRTWVGLVAAGVAVVLLTLPFLLPYLAANASGGIARPRWEVELFSADVYSYLTATVGQRAWAWLQVYAKPEGGLFPSLTLLLLAGLGLAARLRILWVSSASAPQSGFEMEKAAPWRRLAVGSAALLAAGSLLAILLIVAGAGSEVSSWLPGLRLRRLQRPLLLLVLSLAALTLSPRARNLARALWMAPFAFYAAGLLGAFWLSLGPTVTSLGEPLPVVSLYRWLYENVPGYGSLRVPARFAMLVTLFLSVLGGWGALEITRCVRRARLVLSIVSLVFLLESTAAPIVLNDVWRDFDLKKPPARVLVGSATPAIYRAVEGLPAEAVLVEFPFGSSPYELRYMFYSIEHRRRLANGFSGALPASYLARRSALGAVLGEPDRAWGALAGSGATHAVVHEAAWRRGKGKKVTAWLERHGARRLAVAGDDVLLALPRSGTQ